MSQISLPGTSITTRWRRSRVWLLGFVAASALGSAPAAARAEGGTESVAWGQNFMAQLGAGYKDEFETAPVSVAGLTNVTALAAGGQFSLALLGDGTVRAWGAQSLGMGYHEGSATPTPVCAVGVVGPCPFGPYLSGVKAISAAGVLGSGHALALLTNGEEGEGTVVAWGENELGEHGNGKSGTEAETGETIDHPVVVKGLKNVIAIASGQNSNYALKANGEVLAWGEDQFGELGSHVLEKCRVKEQGTFACSKSPAPVEFKEKLPAGVKVTAISAGEQAAYALRSDGRVMAWGYNAHGQLGNRSIPTTGKTGEKMSAEAVEVEALSGVQAVSGGNNFALALVEGGVVYGWGGNSVGELSGTSPKECSLNSQCARTPQPVAGLEHVSAISAGRSFGLALSGGRLYALGTNWPWGQLGVGNRVGPEVCGETKIKEPKTEKELKEKEEEEKEKSCSKKPVEVKGLENKGLENVGGMVAGEQHSLAFVQSGSAPAPQLTLTSEPQALKIVWRFLPPASGEYHIRWISGEAGETAEEDRQEAEAMRQEAKADRERAAEIEGLTEAETKEKEELSKKATELEGRAKQLDEEANKIERAYQPSPDVYKGACSEASPCEYLTSAGRAGKGEIKAQTLKPEGYVVQVNVGLKVHFIHGLALAAEGAPVNTASPTIAGTAQQGQALSEHHGSWTNEPTSYAYQWKRCWPAKRKCTPIAGASAQEYVPTSEDVGHVLTVTEVASNAKGPSDPAVSSRTAVVLPPPPPPPANTSPPTITGSAQLGQTLTEVHGSWTNGPTGYSYQWLQCNALGEGCLAISGATSPTHVLVLGDVGHTIRVQETARNEGGSSSPATSAATSVVLP